MNRARPAAALPLAFAGLALVSACGTNPYATTGAVQPVAIGAQQQPVSAVPAGSLTGQAQPTREKAGTRPATLETTEIDGLGPVLTDTGGRTLYLFTKDGKGSGKSTCDVTCAQQWSPVLADGPITAAEGIDSGLVGRIRRADGTSQVTMGGWPVYTYAQDGAPGEANGHGAGNTWYAMEPNGCKADPARRPDAQQVLATAPAPGGY